MLRTVVKNNYKKGIVLLSVFAGALLLQALRWGYFSISDGSLWGHEAASLLNGGPGEFDFLGAYGHPGGPILEGVIAFWKIGSIAPSIAISWCVSFFNALLITAICAVCYSLRKDAYWLVGVFGILSLNWLYTYATPPSAVAPLLIVLLFLITWLLYESDTLSTKTLVAWGVVAGLSVATRADIGGVSALVFLVPLMRKIGWKKLCLMLVGVFGVFVLADPFMWFMPLQHIKDLLFKVVYHYADFAPTHLSLCSLMSISAFACMSLGLAVSYMFGKQKRFTPVPPTLLSTLICFTVLLYGVFLSAHYQAERYFLPIIFIWETLLPLFVCTYLDTNTLALSAAGIKQRISGKLLKVGFIAALFMYHMYILVLSFELYARFS